MDKSLERIQKLETENASVKNVDGVQNQCAWSGKKVNPIQAPENELKTSSGEWPDTYNDQEKEENA